MSDVNGHIWSNPSPNLVHPSLLNGSANRLLCLLLGKSPLGGKPFLSDTLTAMFTGRSILLKSRRTSSIRGIGRGLLVRSPVTLADRIFPGVPVPDSVPYYSSDEEGGDDDSESESDDSENETHEMLGSPSPSEEEEAIVSRLSWEGGVNFLSFLVSKAVPVHEDKEPKEWTYKDMIGLSAGQLEKWRAACQ